MPPLEGAELDDLLRRSELGDRGSRERIVASNLALVLHHAEARQNLGLSLSDLVQEGFVGLMEAVKSFTAGGATNFAGHADERVGAQMDAALAAEEAAVQQAQLLVAAATDYERTDLVLQRELGRAPSEREIAEKLEWTLDRTRYVAEVVTEARRRHDEELLAYIDPDAVDGEPDESEDVDA